jgi:hypothetical protein
MDLMTACIILALTTISFAVLAGIHWHRAEIAQREIVHLVEQQRKHPAGYDTGLVELNKAA